MAYEYCGRIPDICVCHCCLHLLESPVAFRECEHAYCGHCAVKVAGTENRCRVCAKVVTLQSLIPCTDTPADLLVIVRPTVRAEFDGRALCALQRGHLCLAGG